MVDRLLFDTVHSCYFMPTENKTTCPDMQDLRSKLGGGGRGESLLRSGRLLYGIESMHAK